MVGSSCLYPWKGYKHFKNQSSVLSGIKPGVVEIIHIKLLFKQTVLKILTWGPTNLPISFYFILFFLLEIGFCMKLFDYMEHSDFSIMIYCNEIQYEQKML